jgi:hypothetical protein
MDSLIQNGYAQVGGGCCSFIWIGLTIWAMVHTLGSRASATVKVLWILGLWFFPWCGLILWLFVGPRQGRPEY